MFKVKHVFMERSFVDGCSGGGSGFSSSESLAYEELMALHEESDKNLEIRFSKRTGVSHYGYENEIREHDSLADGKGLVKEYPELEFSDIKLSFIRFDGQKVSARTSYLVSGKREDVKRFTIIEHGITSENFELKYPLKTKEAKKNKHQSFKLKIHPDKLSMFESSLKDFKSRNSTVSFVIKFKKFTGRNSKLCSKLNIRHSVVVNVTAPTCMFDLVENIIEHCKKSYFHSYKYDFKKNENEVRI